MNHEVVIVSGARTAIGNFGGGLKDSNVVEIGGTAVRGVLEKTKIDPELIDEAWIGHARQAGNGPNPGKLVGIEGGIPYNVPTTTIQMACLSSLQATVLGYKSILMGDAKVVIAGGVEHMSSIPYLNFNVRWGNKAGDVSLIDGLSKDGFLDPMTGMTMGKIADTYAERWKISREEQDRFAIQSNINAAKGWDNGFHQQMIVPTIMDKRGKEVSFNHDEHYRKDANMESMSKLKPAFNKNGTITPGNASGVTDGGAAIMMMEKELAIKLNLKPLAKIIGYGMASMRPEDYGISPVLSTQQALSQAGIDVKDVDIWEINEAFAVQALAVAKELEIDSSLINPYGGAIALGHPVGMSGVRNVMSAAYSLLQNQKRYAVATLCGNGGQGGSLVLEKI